MEHVVVAEAGGTVREVRAGRRGHGREGRPPRRASSPARWLGRPRGGGRVVRRRSGPSSPSCSTGAGLLDDDARPEAMARRHATGQRSARENLADLCDPGSFVEYGALVVAAQRRRRPVEELIERTPADGLVGGHRHGQRRPVRSRAVPLRRRLLRLHRAGRHPGPHEPPQEGPAVRPGRAAAACPLVLFAEGGGGRPGDTDGAGVTGLDDRGLRPVRPAERARAHGRDRRRAAASPATRHCSAAATSSSPPPTPTSAWAARR